MSTKPPQILGHGASEANDDEEIRDPRLEILESLSDGISHELNSPLQILTDSFGLLIEMNRTMLNLVEQTAPQESLHSSEVMDELEFVRTEAEPNYERIHQGLKRIESVVETFKVFAGEQNRPERPNIDVQPILIDAVEPFRKHGVDIQLTCQLSTEVFALEDDIHTIVGELLSNAIQATLKKSRENPLPILVSATNDSRDLILKVQDEGVGIAPKIQSRIFDPFFATHRDGINRGRGLCIIRQLIRRKYRGQITCTSIVDEGATFEVRLRLNSPE